MGHDDAYQQLAGRAGAAVFLTCEHASQRLPDGWSYAGRDARLVDTHWAYDLGAREIVLELAGALGSRAVLARFSRLLVDANRPEDSDTLFLSHADGEEVELNRAIPAAESHHRLERYYRSYHAAIDRGLAACRAEVVLAVHTFTPVYDGQERAMEVGVLFDREDALADRVARALADAGMAVAMNEPYSGKDGLIHSADVHARRSARRALEIEVRQDCSQSPAFRRRLVRAVAALLG